MPRPTLLVAQVCVSTALAAPLAELPLESVQVAKLATDSTGLSVMLAPTLPTRQAEPESAKTAQAVQLVPTQAAPVQNAMPGSDWTEQPATNAKQEPTR